MALAIARNSMKQRADFGTAGVGHGLEWTMVPAYRSTEKTQKGRQHKVEHLLTCRFLHTDFVSCDFTEFIYQFY